ncbi:MAG: TetR/AcrR family transcriptional regulator [Anaerolineae bacterium]
MPKAFTEREKELISKRLLEQGYKQFSAYGLKKTNIGELAEAAGISKGAFYIFYKSKEALFMDVVELTEKRFRQEVLAAIDLPGPSPRGRLSAVLQFLTGSDSDLLYRRVPAEKFQEHLANDRVFIEEFVTRCRQAGIPIQVQAEEISGLLYALVLTILHEEDFGPNNLVGTVDILLELVAAFCLGEVELQSQAPIRSTSEPEEGQRK